MYQFNFDFNAFLENYWHKKPTIIKNAFGQFHDPISPNEIAGLAMEEEIDSRRVTCLNDQWQVEDGPFESFDDFPETHCQLIVQAANHWHQGINALTLPFQSLPNWLFDDLMVCLSMPEGGVGPHIDQYDVFIIQGMGKRHWKVGEKGDYQDANHETGLRQITGFDPIIDAILEPGDMLYIPPGFPHEGKSLEVSISYSMGYRSPKKKELLSGFADHIISQDLGDSHLNYPQIKTRNAFGIIPNEEYQALNQMLMSLLNDDNVKMKWLGEQLSLSRHELNIFPADPLWTLEELHTFLDDGMELEKVLGLKILFHEKDPSHLYINGNTYSLEGFGEELAFLLSQEKDLNKTKLSTWFDNQAFLELLLQWCNDGYFYPKE